MLKKIYKEEFKKTSRDEIWYFNCHYYSDGHLKIHLEYVALKIQQNTVWFIIALNVYEKAPRVTKNSTTKPGSLVKYCHHHYVPI
jgi:hypothetical protein